MTDVEPDYLFKLLMIGDSGVGKSSLLLRLTEDTFKSQYTSTIGVDFKIRTIDVSGNIIKLQIWDTAGQERFRSIISSYYRGSHAVIIAFDLSDVKSFENMRMWINERDKYCNSNVLTLIVGTKCDLQCEVTDEMIHTFCREFNVSYIKTSSKTNTNVIEAFKKISMQLMEKNGINYIKKNDRKILLNSNTSVISLLNHEINENDEYKKNKNKKCC